MRRRWWAVGIAVFVVGLIATAPAEWLGEVLARQTGSRILLANPSGTVWRGSGFLLIKQGEHTFDVGAVRWSVSPWPLVLLRISTKMELTGDGMQGSGTVVALPKGSLAIDKLNLRASADSLSAVYPPLGFFAPSGRLEAVAESLTIDRQNIAGSASVTWQGAGVNLTSVRPLGDYQLRMNGTDTGLALDVTTQGQGALAVNGSGTYDASSGRLIFKGRAEAVTQADALRPLLNLLGPPADEPNARAIAINRTLGRRGGS